MILLYTAQNQVSVRWTTYKYDQSIISFSEEESSAASEILACIFMVLHGITQKSFHQYFLNCISLSMLHCSEANFGEKK